MTHAARTHDIFEKLQAMRDTIDALMVDEHARLAKLDAELVAAKCTTALKMVRKCRLAAIDKQGIAAALEEAVQLLKDKAA